MAWPPIAGREIRKSPLRSRPCVGVVADGAGLRARQALSVKHPGRPRGLPPPRGLLLDIAFG